MADDLTTWLRQQIQERKALAEASASKPRRIPYLEDGEWKYRSVVDDGAWAYDQVKDGYHRGQDRVISTGGEDLGVVAGACRCCGGTPAEGRTEDLLHIVANDPQDTIARCEFELVEIARHEESAFRDCVLCGEREDAYPCDYLRRHAYGYRRRTGWNPDWAPEGTAT